MRKIIHIDMDCFYAAVELRDQPQLQNQPVAVGGASDRRGVLCTCNYVAREYGVHSAMPTQQALELCPNLVLLPVDFTKYRAVSTEIREIFTRYTELIEPLSLDEAYLDVSECQQHHNSATWIAEAIRADIVKEQGITASAGIAPNKFLAKIASDWRKPNGQFVIPPEDIDDFIADLPVKKIFGVGKVTAYKLAQYNIHICRDLQSKELKWLIEKFGRFGAKLHLLAQGIDKREVKPERDRKSLSVENTFTEDLMTMDQCLTAVEDLFTELQRRLQRQEKSQLDRISKQFIKLKFSDFSLTTYEETSTDVSLTHFSDMCRHAFEKQPQAVRLLGLGVRFSPPQPEQFSLEF